MARFQVGDIVRLRKPDMSEQSGWVLDMDRYDGGVYMIETLYDSSRDPDEHFVELKGLAWAISSRWLEPVATLEELRYLRDEVHQLDKRCAEAEEDYRREHAEVERLERIVRDYRDAIALLCP